jgi:hypothetical protein
MGATNDWFLTFKAAGAVGARRVTKFTANRGEVALATAVTDKLAGVCDLGAAAAGDMIDAAMGGRHEVVAGGVVAAGDKLTTDANGAAVVAAPVLGSVVHVFGVALAPAVAGDVFPYLVAPSVIAPGGA